MASAATTSTRHTACGVSPDLAWTRVGTRVRGFVMTVVSIVGIVVSVIDGIDDDFSIWNGVGIVCFLVVLAYGLAYLRSDS